LSYIFHLIKKPIGFAAVEAHTNPTGNILLTIGFFYNPVNTTNIQKKNGHPLVDAHLFSQNKKVKKERGKDSIIFVKVYIRPQFFPLGSPTPFLPLLAVLGVLCIFYP
jgi:hypothetical protein